MPIQNARVGTASRRSGCKFQFHRGFMMINNEFWENCVVTKRLLSTEKAFNSESRSPFDMDHDRIIYSNFFRRMHDKTQVFPYAPLSNSGQARSRLSHSLEVSCVARSLGNLLGHYLVKNGAKIRPYDIGMIVASACLAHDIGNPPFGHSGEYAIQSWISDNLEFALKDKWEKNDIMNFEGNAQGFRILSRLESCQRPGGLRPTVSTLAAFMKYPCASIDTDKNSNNPGLKKFGFFKADRESFDDVFDSFNIPRQKNCVNAYTRHPFAFLTEAADDICYAIVDLEDAYHLSVIGFDSVYDLLMPIVSSDPSFKDNKEFDKDIRVARMRSAAISVLIDQVIDVFTSNIELFENYSFSTPLINKIDLSSSYSIIKNFSFNRIYNSSRVLEIECAGFKTIGGLFDMFVNAVLTDKPVAQEKISRQLIPSQYFKRHENSIQSNNHSQLIESLSTYEKILSITDYICGMTDRYAVELYQRISGIRLPVY
ncbi:MAG: dNTP triphosphohydrolase [Spirochaetes bacterium]|nr:dNTP triphosphohydrolase [Spirochaetota bacterium]